VSARVKPERHKPVDELLGEAAAVDRAPAIDPPCAEPCLSIEKARALTRKKHRYARARIIAVS
jgi:hypothetical protein